MSMVGGGEEGAEGGRRGGEGRGGGMKGVDRHRIVRQDPDTIWHTINGGALNPGGALPNVSQVVSPTIYIRHTSRTTPLYCYTSTRNKRETRVILIKREARIILIKREARVILIKR